jgi:effector-associated domain 1 (EAD1)-containing protein/trypsin-like peptidase
MAIDLKGHQADAFTDALASAFLDFEELEMMVRFGLNEKLRRITKVDSQEKVAFALINWAEQHDRLDELLAAALKRNPGNAKLKQLAYEVFLTSDAVPATNLEALVMPAVPFQDVVGWRERMARSERCVCRVEIPGTGNEWKGVGTAFLVGPDVLLTNKHVANEMVGGARVQFDYVLDAAGAGRVCALAQDWLVADSPINELDFALVRLAESAGSDPLEGASGRSRGWLQPKPHTFTLQEPLLILQHPSAEHLKLGVGSVKQLQAAPQRIHYTTNTLGGSSGSPCFTLGWELVALHHAGAASANLGVPMGAILARLTEQKKAGLLAPPAP